MRTPRLVLIAALCVAALTGCTADGSTIPASVSPAFERDVRDIARLAAEERYPAALVEVAALRQAVREALAAGTLGADRAARITAALDLVEADLTRAARAVAPTPTPSPTKAAAPAPAPRTTSAPLTEEQGKKAEEVRKKAAEEAAKRAEEAEKKAEEQAKKAEEEQQKKQEKEREKQDDEGGD